MKHHHYKEDFKFVVDPIDFNKYTERKTLQYCLGATLYMPGYTDFANLILTKKFPGLTSIVLCFEDACKLEDVPQAEKKCLGFLDQISEEIEKGNFLYSDLPLITFRVRNLEQFKHFSSQLKPQHIPLITAFNFPKFNISNGDAYFSYLKQLNKNFEEIIYGMPILEDSNVAYRETRMTELLGVKEILDQYRDLVLNIRVGGTDFSSCFGVRRGISYTIYDILTVRDALTDILNVFTRNNEYTISGPVWEYFRASKEMRWDDLPEFDFAETLIKRETIVNDAVDGLLRELIMDKANGFVGKTIIHPSHLVYVNGMMAVTNEEYEDAEQILATSGGVIKSKSSNKMNEIGPHRNWAEKIILRSKAYGVVENQGSFLKLFTVEER